MIAPKGPGHLVRSEFQRGGGVSGIPGRNAAQAVLMTGLI